MNLFQISIFIICTKTIYGLGRYESNWLIPIELIHKNRHIYEQNHIISLYIFICRLLKFLNNQLALKNIIF